MYYTAVSLPLGLELRVCKLPLIKTTSCFTRDTGATHRCTGTQLRSHSQCGDDRKHTERNKTEETRQKTRKEKRAKQTRKQNKKEEERGWWRVIQKSAGTAASACGRVHPPVKVMAECGYFIRGSLL